ncbi:t-SNARE [Meredithblackwellia eburnea MCA 4105]
MTDSHTPIDGFFDQVDAIKSKLVAFRECISHLSELYSKNLVGEQGAQVAPLIHSRRTEASSLAEEARAGITWLNRESKNELASSKDSQTVERFELRKSHLKALHRSFSSMLKDFYGVEQHAWASYREQVESRYRLVSPNASPEEMEAVVLENQRSSQIFGMEPRQVIHSRQSSASSARTAVEARDDQLREIEMTIVGLAKVMNDLATMVFEQDTLFEDIEAKACQTEKDTDAALQHLTIARKIAAGARRRRWWIFGCCFSLLVIIIALILVVFVFHAIKI